MHTDAMNPLLIALLAGFGRLIVLTNTGSFVSYVNCQKLNN